MYNIKKDKKYIILFILIVFGIIGYYLFFRSHTNDEILQFNEIDTIENNDTNEEVIVKEKIKVYVAGAVMNPGVYELDEGARVVDATGVAGGLLENADITNVNLAYALEDGMKVYIPKNGENQVESSSDLSAGVEASTSVAASSNSATKQTTSKKININSATQEELETLPGIGSATALKIINYRKEKGKFKTIEDIKNVSGIGDSKFSKIKDLITI